MGNFFDRLAGRALGVVPVAEPLVPSVAAAGSQLGSASAALEASSGVSTEARPSSALDGVPATVHESLPGRESDRSIGDRLTGEHWASDGRAGDRCAKEEIRISQSQSADNRSTFADPIVHASPPVVTGTAWADSSENLGERVPEAARPGVRGNQGRVDLGGVEKTQISGHDPIVGRIVPRSIPVSGRTSSIGESPASRTRRAGADDRGSAPVIRVTIGRVDVRAQFSSSAPSTAAPRPKKAPILSLEQYAKQRDQGRR